MYTKSGNKEFMNHDNVDDIVKELFKKLVSRYRDNLETRMEKSEFGFDSVQLMY